jgi:hypothetical protein
LYAPDSEFAVGADTGLGSPGRYQGRILEALGDSFWWRYNGVTKKLRTYIMKIVRYVIVLRCKEGG